MQFPGRGDNITPEKNKLQRSRTEKFYEALSVLDNIYHIMVMFKHWPHFPGGSCMFWLVLSLAWLIVKLDFYFCFDLKTSIEYYKKIPNGLWKRKFQVFFKKQLLKHVPFVAFCGRKQKYVFYVMWLVN